MEYTTHKQKKLSKFISSTFKQSRGLKEALSDHTIIDKLVAHLIFYKIDIGGILIALISGVLAPLNYNLPSSALDNNISTLKQSRDLKEAT